MNSLKFFIVICSIAGISSPVFADDSSMVAATSSTAAASSSMAATTSATSSQKPRLRLFGQNGFSVAIYPKSKCEGGANKITMSGGLGAAFSSFFGSVKNESIGIPETETTKYLARRDGLLSKAYFREYQIDVGEPITIAAGYSDAAGTHCDTLANTFVPESGVDYESRLDVDLKAKTCTLIMNRVGQDGSLSPLPIVRAASCN